MTVRSRLAMVLIMSATFTLAIGIGIFDRLSVLNRAEGAKLYTEDAFMATGNPSRILSAAGDRDFRIFVESPADPNVRIVYAGDVSRVAAPVYDGRSFSDHDRNVALAGADVPVSQGAQVDTPTVQVEGRAYPVIGRLGSTSDSLLRNSVVIAGDAPPAEPRTRMIIDGPDGKGAYGSAYPSGRIENIDVAVSSRVDSDEYSPLIVRASRLTLLLAFCCAGLVAARLYSAPRTVLILQGHSRASVALSLVLELSLASLAAFAVSTLLCSTASRLGGQIATIVTTPLLGFAITGLVACFACYTDTRSPHRFPGTAP